MKLSVPAARKVVAEAEALEPRRLLAASYYVSPSGNDAHAGTSPQSAWRSIARVNEKNFDPGDKVYFEGGKTFSVAGSKGANVLTNPSFTSGLAGWSDTLGTSSARSSVISGGHSGASLKISGAGAGTRAQDITSKVTSAQAYEIRAYTRSLSVTGGDRRVGVTFYAAGKNVGTFYRGFRAGDWRETAFAFVAPRSFDKAVFWVSRWGDSSTFYVDDVSFRALPNGLVFDETDSGTATNPLTVGSYGSGRATINAIDGIGLTGINVSGLSVQNLNLTGTWNGLSGSGTNTGVGIDFVNSQPGNTKLNFIRVDHVDVKGFRWAGIRVGGWNGKSGYRDVKITNAAAHSNGDAGILVRGDFDKASALYANESIYIGASVAYDNGGIPDKGNNTGSGIQLTDTHVGVIERCVAYHNGKFNTFADGGPVGIWAFDASMITVQKNESYANYTASGKDGAGFDLDGGVTNSIVQYNYSHDNDGPGYLLCQFSGARTWGKNIVRYNISQNDARKNGYGAVTLTGGAGIANAVVENNTIFISPARSGAACGIRLTGVGAGVFIRNNIIQTSGGVALLEADANSTAARFNSNDYWPSGSTFKVKWAGAAYGSLASWRSAAKQEMSGTVAMGRNVDPRLAAPGTGKTLNNASLLETLAAYKLKSDSALIDAAASLPSPFRGYTAGSIDFFGRKITGAWNIGA